MINVAYMRILIQTKMMNAESVMMASMIFWSVEGKVWWKNDGRLPCAGAITSRHPKSWKPHPWTTHLQHHRVCIQPTFTIFARIMIRRSLIISEPTFSYADLRHNYSFVTICARP